MAPGGLWPDLDRAGLAKHLASELPVPAGDPADWARSASAATIRERAAADRGTPWPPASAHAWARFRRDGDRVEYESGEFARTRRLSRAVVAALAEPSPANLDEVLDGVVLACEQSSWCWPAHDDAWDRRGEALPDVDAPCVDLGAGETAAQLAWVDAVLGQTLGQWCPGLRRRVRLEAERRVFVPFLTRHDWGWATRRPDNWTPWIVGNVMTAALQLVDDPDRRAELVLACVRGLDRYVAALPDDGACDEGAAYWWHGPCRLLEALLLLRDATGGWLDALAQPGLPGLRATVAFPGAMALGDGWRLDFGDASARAASEQPWHALFRLSRALGDADAGADAMAGAAGRDVQVDDGLGRCLLELADAEWARRPRGVRATLPREVWYPCVEVFVAREQAGRPDGLTVGAKGGHNGENHNHADVGTLIVALDGVPVVVDAGRATYTAATFGPDRYQLWPMRSAWHNVPLVDGAEQGVGPQFRTAQATARLGPQVSAFTADIGTAYPGGPALRRRVSLDRVRCQVRVDDAWDPGRAVQERFLLAGTVVEDAPGRAVVQTVAGACGLLRWSPETPGEFVERPLDDPLLREVWGERLTQLRLTPVGTSFLLIIERNDHNGSSAPAVMASAGSRGTTGGGPQA